MTHLLFFPQVNIPSNRRDKTNRQKKTKVKLFIALKSSKEGEINSSNENHRKLM